MSNNSTTAMKKTAASHIRRTESREGASSEARKNGWGVAVDQSCNSSTKELNAGNRQNRNVLPEVWVHACIIATLIYVGALAIFGALPGSKGAAASWLQDPRYMNEEDETFKWVSEMCTAAFLASAARNVGALVLWRDWSAQRPVVWCVVLVNCVAAHAHWLMASSSAPVYDSCFGRKMHAARYAEWLSMVFLLAVVMNALDCPSWSELVWSTSVQFASITLGFLASIACHIWGPVHVDGFCPKRGGDNSTSANEGHWKHRGVSNPEDLIWWTPSAIMRSSIIHKIQIMALLLSVVCFMDLIRVLQRRLAQPAVTTSGTQAALLKACATLQCSYFVIIHIVATFSPSWLDARTEELAYTAGDLVAKFVYANVLSNANLMDLWTEQAYRAQLAQKQQANEAQRDFLRYVFHEVRVPLNTIRLGIDSIQQGNNFDSESNAVVSCMDEAVNTMSGTLDDVLSYQKIEEGKVELELRPFVVDDLLRSVTFGFEAIAQAKSLELKQENDPHLPPELIGDTMRLRQILNNLMSNAIKFTDIDGSITIAARLIGLEPVVREEAPEQADSASKQQRMQLPIAANRNLDDSDVEPARFATVEFSVTDTGIGIAPEGRKKLFQAFSQIRAGDLQSGRGSGLGLSICKHMIHLMGGIIDVRSQPGRGSTFFFRVTLRVTAPGSAEARRSFLPGSKSNNDNQNVDAEIHDDGYSDTNSAVQLLSSDSSSPQSLSFPASSPCARRTSSREQGFVHQRSSSPTPLTALIVDDVTMNRKMIKRCMQQLGFTCEEACDGAEAVAMCALNQYGLVLMDNVMPCMNGMEAAAAIRRHDALHRLVGTHIFGLTGNALSEDVAEFQRAGCDEVLTKPLHMDLLKRLLSEYGLSEDIARD